MLSRIDFTPGKITHDDFDLDSDSTLDEENDSLKEDMFQVLYPSGYVLDIGWYSGVRRFIIHVIKDFDWEHPVKKIMCNDLNELVHHVTECAEYLKQKLLG